MADLRASQERRDLQVKVAAEKEKMKAEMGYEQFYNAGESLNSQQAELEETFKKATETKIKVSDVCVCLCMCECGNLGCSFVLLYLALSLPLFVA